MLGWPEWVCCWKDGDHGIRGEAGGGFGWDNDARNGDNCFRCTTEDAGGGGGDRDGIAVSREQPKSAIGVKGGERW